LVEQEVCTQTQQLDPADLQLEVVTDEHRFYAMGQEWDRLVARAAVDQTFHSHIWLRTWWESFGEGKQLHVITLRAGGELVAAVPLMRTRARMYGLRLNTIETIYNPHTPRCDFIIAGDRRPGIYERIWRELSHTDRCDAIVLNQVPDNSPTVPAIDGLAQADGWLTGQWASPPSPYIPLNCTYEEFFAGLKRGDRYNLRKRHERLGKLGHIDVEVIPDRNGLREAMEDGLRIEAAAWKGQHGTAIASDTAVTEFYLRLAEREADLGHLRLSFLRVGGKRISFNYLLRNNKTLYGVKIGYDPEYHTYSPGNALLNLILQQACADGMAEYDFLGVDDAWKFDWTRQTRRHRWLFLFRNNLRPKLLHYVKFTILPRVKQVLNKS
jgi:CelD/BcsL family acetyltransferase involved in cellulose biosynthesis